ncbi:high affinity immunoglobulin epsilon receptor subunit alpha-like isoform X3 [Channa argus]|uniref:high affinity immunoglobulin epsilon receptor subunit alpha-like isoform X3 n=1 Tax=Channa argus TaxID=215402 RepID=UPI0035210B34
MASDIYLMGNFFVLLRQHLGGYISSKSKKNKVSSVFYKHIFHFLFEPPAATLIIQPDRSQFFRYENISLSCAGSADFNKWTVRRNTSTKTSQTCRGDFGDPQESSCILNDIYTIDSGLYWCESEDGNECSNTLNITVAAGAVILESPALPVTEGDEVTLRCSHKKRFDPQPTSDFSATFFKDGVFIGTEAEAKMILPSVKQTDEGFYKCKHPTDGESAESLLVVTGGNKMDSA